MLWAANPYGNNSLVAMNLPWVETTFHARATGLPANCFALGGTALSPLAAPIPLASLFLEGVPGCDLLVDPQSLVTLFPTNQVVASFLFLPADPALVGVNVFRQIVPFEFVPATGALVAITGTNALQLTIGMF